MSNPTPICNYWFIKQGVPNTFLEYDGTSNFKRCTRCKGAFYLDQNAQKLHWKSHKKCCKLVGDITVEGLGYDIDTCVSEIKSLLYQYHGLSNPPELYHVMKRLRTLMDDDVDGVSDAAFKLHSMARGLICYQSDKLMMNAVACPHMANLLLSDEEDLLSKKNRFVKQHLLEKYNGRPSEEYVEDLDDEKERDELRKLVEQYDQLDNLWGQPSSMSYCYLYFNLIVACAIRGNMSRCSIHDGCGVLRGGDPHKKSPESLLAVAALRRAMELWTDPLVLSSCGDAMAPAASLALTATETYQSGRSLLCGKHELVPGLPIDKLVITCLSELLEAAGSAQYSVKLLERVGGIVTVNFDRLSSIVDLAEDGRPKIPEPWKDLSIERRARLALAVIHYIERVDEDRSPMFGGSITQPYEAVNNILKTITGMQNNPNEDSIAEEVWKKAAEEEVLGVEGAGHNVRCRAFAYYFSRGAFPCYEVDKIGDQSFPKNTWESLDMVLLFKAYEKIPRISKAPDAAKAKEKDECLRLARGDKDHARMSAIWSRVSS